MATSSVTREDYHVSPRGVVHFSLPLLVHYCITGDSYILLNPLRAKLVPDYPGLKHFPYCGHGVLLGKRHNDWQNTDYVWSQFGKSPSRARRLYHEFVKKGYDFGRLVDRVAGLLHIDRDNVTRPGRYPETVEARSVLCYWAARELGVSTLELSKRLAISQPTASQSVKRSEKLVADRHLKLID